MNFRVLHCFSQNTLQNTFASSVYTFASTTCEIAETIKANYNGRIYPVKTTDVDYQLCT